MLPQCFTGVLGAERPAFLQERHHPVDEFVQPVWRQVRHQDEPVAGIGLDVAVDLVGDVQCGADELLSAGHGDDQLTYRQVLRFGAFAVTAGHRDRVTVPDPSLSDVAIDDRVDIG